MFEVNYSKNKEREFVIKNKKVYLSEENATLLRSSVEDREIKGYLVEGDDKYPLYDFTEEIYPLVSSKEEKEEVILSIFELDKVIKSGKTQFKDFHFRGYVEIPEGYLVPSYSLNRFPTSPYVDKYEAFFSEHQIFTKEEFSELVLKEKKFYLTASNASFLNLTINKDWNFIGFLDTEYSESCSYYAIYEATDLPFTYLDDDSPEFNHYSVYEQQIRFHRGRTLAEHFKPIGYYFSLDNNVFFRVHSIKDHMKEQNIPMVKEIKKTHVLESDLGKLTHITEQVHTVGYCFAHGRNLTLIPSYDVEEYCEKVGIKLFDEDEELVYPYFHEDELKKLDKKLYIGKEAGLVVEEGRFGNSLKGIYNLETISKEANVPIMSLDEYEQNEYLFYVSKGKTQYFPKGWDVKKDLIRLAIREDRTEILGFADGLKGYFGISTPTVSDLVIPYQKLYAFQQRVRKEGLSIDDMPPRSVTEDGDFIFDTRNNKEWAKFRVRYLLNPLK